MNHTGNAVGPLSTNWLQIIKSSILRRLLLCFVLFCYVWSIAFKPMNHAPAQTVLNLAFKVDLFHHGMFDRLSNPLARDYVLRNSVWRSGKINTYGSHITTDHDWLFYRAHEIDLFSKPLGLPPPLVEGHVCSSPSVMVFKDLCDAKPPNGDYLLDVSEFVPFNIIVVYPSFILVCNTHKSMIWGG